MRERIGRKWTDKVRYTDDLTDKCLNILVWGPPGSGKTHFIETAPKPFLINTDKGELTMHRSHIPSVALDGTTQVYETIMAILDSARKKKDGFEEIETIGLDSVWKLSDLLLEEIKEEKNTTGKAGFDDWGELLTRMAKIVDGFTASPYHFIATSGEAIRQDDMDAEEKVVTFNFSGSYRSRLAYAFDFNLYFLAKKRGLKTEYIAFSQEENKRTAKSRVSMPRQIVDPSFSTIQGLVTAGLEKKGN